MANLSTRSTWLTGERKNEFSPLPGEPTHMDRAAQYYRDHPYENVDLSGTSMRPEFERQYTEAAVKLLAPVKPETEIFQLDRKTSVDDVVLPAGAWVMSFGSWVVWSSHRRLLEEYAAGNFVGRQKRARRGYGGVIQLFT